MRAVLKIRTHLIPFLFKEMAGTEHDYIKRKKTEIVISKFSTLGQFLHAQIGEQRHEQDFMLKLVLDKKELNVYDGTIYIIIKHEMMPVVTTDIKVTAINNLFEDLFRIGFIYFVDGYISFAPQRCITTAIDQFIDKYDLLELGFTTAGLRSLYYRHKTAPLERIQLAPAKRVANYST